MPLGLAQAAIIGDLRDLKIKLKEQGLLISRGFKKMESEKKARDDRRKEIVLEVLKASLKTLHDIDSELVKEIKSEVYDKKEAIENLDEKLTRFIKSVKSSEAEDEEWMRAAVKELTDNVAALQLEQFSRLVCWLADFSTFSCVPVVLSWVFQRLQYPWQKRSRRFV